MASKPIKFSGLVNASELSELMSSFYDVIGVSNAVIDTEGVVIAHSGWQQACTEFHRVNKGTCERCIQSDTSLVERLTQGEEFAVYRCLNGLVDTAAPIIVDGQHVANLFTGQFFTEPPDLEFFRKQAIQFNFNETAYLDAIRKVPILPMSRVQSITRFYANIALMLARSGLDHLRQKEAEQTLEQLNLELHTRVEQRTRELSEKNLVLQGVLDAIPEMVFWKDADLHYLGGNLNFAKAAGLASPEEIRGLTDKDFSWGGMAEVYEADDRTVIKSGVAKLHVEESAKNPDGTLSYASISKVPLRDQDGRIIGIVGAYEDITDRKQAETLISRYKWVVETTTDGFWITDMNGILVEANPAYARISGYSREELVGMQISQLEAIELTPENVQAHINKIRQNGGDHFETLHRRKDGSQIDIEVSVTYLAGTDQLAAFCRDISERKAMEMALRTSEERFRAYFEKSMVGMAITSPEKGWLGVNPALCDTLGYSQDELTRMTWAELTHPEDLAADVVQFNKLLAGELDGYSLDKRFIQKNGRLVYTRLAVRGVQKPQGGIDYCVAMVEDITERKQTEMELLKITKTLRQAQLRQEQTNRLHQAFINIEQSILRLKDETDLLDAVCEAAVEFGGMKMAWVGTVAEDGNSIRCVSRYGDGLEYLDGLKVCIDANVPEGRGPTGTALRENLAVMVNNYSSNPLTSPWHARVSAYGFQSAATFPINRAGKPFGVLTVYSDQTEAFDEESFTLFKRMSADISFAIDSFDNEKNRLAAEQALKQSNADLEQFAYSVSHDMRQPLRMVTGHLQLLGMSLEGQLNQDDQENMHFALDGAKRMDAMIVSLLEYSRVGRLTSAMEWLDSRLVIDEALHFLTPAIEEAHTKVSIEGQWPKAFISRDEFSRLFQNLVSNALHYHQPEQAPVIDVVSTVSAGQWRVSIKDQGIGIDPAQSERLFKFFSRLQARSKFEGTGMGLALCRRIIEHHHGRIWVESEGEGKGSTFLFEIPLEAAAPNGEADD